MKKKIIMGIALLTMILTIVTVINHYKYRQVIGDLKIVHYIVSGDENLDYLSVRLNVVLPAKKYHGNLTMNLIRLYVIIRHEKIPNSIAITLYDSMEKLGDGDSYADRAFDR